MTDLLTSAEKAQIDQALLDSMDTLHRSDIKLFVKSESLDIRQINTNATYVQYDLKTIIKEVNKDNYEGVEGSRDINRFECKFHIQHLIDAGLASVDRKLLFNSSECILEYREQQHRLVAVKQEDIAVRFECEALPVSINFDIAITPDVQRYSMDFNGVNNYGQVQQQNNNIFDLDWTQPFSFECWHYYTPGVTSYLLSKINPNAGYFYSCVGARDVLRFQLRVTSPFQIIDVNSTDTLTEGWNHIVVAYNGGGGAEQDVTFYINSVDSPKPNDWSQGNQLTGGSLSNTSLLEIQRLSSFGVYGAGKIAHTRLWNNIELNSTEVQTLFNSGQVLYNGIPNPNNLLFNCGFGDDCESWFGQSWVMQELTGNSSFVLAVNSIESDRTSDVPT